MRGGGWGGAGGRVRGGLGMIRAVSARSVEDSKHLTALLSCSSLKYKIKYLVFFTFSLFIFYLHSDFIPFPEQAFLFSAVACILCHFLGTYNSNSPTHVCVQRHPHRYIWIFEILLFCLSCGEGKAARNRETMKQLYCCIFMTICLSVSCWH